MRALLRSAWSFLRAVSGDSAYERYLASPRKAGHAPLSAKDFYLDALRRRYSNVSRCC